MPKTIQQAIAFPVPPERLYRTYLSARAHAAACLILALHLSPGGSRLEMVHANVPDAHVGGITRGWRTYYWNPWRTYLKKTMRAR